MKKLMSLLLVMLLCFSIAAPSVQVDASSTVRMEYKGKVKNFKNKKTYAYVNNQKIKLAKQPIFLKSGCYSGPVNKLLKNSSLKVSIISSSSTTLTLKYGSKVMVLNNGSRYATVNGVRSRMGGPAMYAKYMATGKRKWIVPLNSVCTRLGISYKMKGGVIHIGGTTNRPVETPGISNNDPQPDHNGQITLVLDAGHGGVDSGATGNGYREKQMTLSILLGAKRYFDHDSRFKVYYTRTSDTYPSLDDRCKLANNHDADLFVSVHINSASASARGTETLYNWSRNTVTAKDGMTSKELASSVQQSVVASTGFSNRGLKNRTDLRVLNQTKMPACLIEYGFISNPSEARIMNANLDRYGKELYEAIVRYLQSERKL